MTQLAERIKDLFHALKEAPSWMILFALFIVLLTGYYIRPDNVTEDSLKAVVGALLLSLRSTQPAPPNQ